jgi:hypothetical protein
MAFNDDSKCKIEEEAESSMVRKRLWLSNDDGGDDDSFDSPDEEEETEEEEVSSEEMLMNQLDTSEDKLYDRHAPGILFSDNGNTPSIASQPRTPESRQCSDEESSDDDDEDF